MKNANYQNFFNFVGLDKGLYCKRNLLAYNGQQDKYNKKIDRLIDKSDNNLKIIDYWQHY